MHVAFGSHEAKYSVSLKTRSNLVRNVALTGEKQETSTCRTLLFYVKSRLRTAPYFNLASIALPPPVPLDPSIPKHHRFSSLVRTRALAHTLYQPPHPLLMVNDRTIRHETAFACDMSTPPPPPAVNGLASKAFKK